VAELRRAVELKSGEDTRKLNLTVVREHHEQTVPVEVKRPEPFERGKETAGLGIDSGEWQRAAAEARKQMADAQLALQEAQKHMGDQQRLLSEQLRRAAEKYRQAARQQLQEQLKKAQTQLKSQTQEEIRLQLQERLRHAAALGQTI